MLDRLKLKKLFGIKPKQPTQQDKATPKETLSHFFPEEDWPISGGWGTSPENAVVLEIDNEPVGVEFEYKFITYYYQLFFNINCPDNERMDGFEIEQHFQMVEDGKDGQMYDKHIVFMAAFYEKDYEFLINLWVSHNGFENDEEGKKAFKKLSDEKKMILRTDFWFDISNFYGKMPD